MNSCSNSKLTSNHDMINNQVPKRNKSHDDAHYEFESCETENEGKMRIKEEVVDIRGPGRPPEKRGPGRPPLK